MATAKLGVRYTLTTSLAPKAAPCVAPPKVPTSVGVVSLLVPPDNTVEAVPALSSIWVMPTVKLDTGT